MVESFLANRCYYQQIIQEHEKDFSFDSLIVAKVMDYSLCKNGKDIVDQLRLIASALDRCQSDGSSLADACDAWLGLLLEPALHLHEKVVNKRFQDAITLEHLTAYMLHTTYREEKLTTEQQQDVSTWLANRDPGFITSFICFQAKAAPFPGSYFSIEAISISPHTCLPGAAVCAVDPAFADLAQRLTTSTASSASIERLFNTFCFIHSKIRNRLGVQKACKLVFCYYMLHGTKDLDC